MYRIKPSKPVALFSAVFGVAIIVFGVLAVLVIVMILFVIFSAHK